jgi:hexosaminidase
MFYPQMEVSASGNGLNIHFKSGEPNYHFDLFTRSDEKVPTMNGGQIVGEKDTLYFERTKGNKQVNYTFRVSSENLSDPSTFKLKVHPSIGLPVELVTKPDSRYKGKGGLTLVDGIKGGKPWKGHEWLGYDTTHIEFIVDLGKLSAIKGYEIGFLQDEGSWIHTPERVEAYYSKNKKKWKKVSKVDAMDPLKVSEEFTQHFYYKGRYLKLVVQPMKSIPVSSPGEGNIPWTFIDELIIFFE